MTRSRANPLSELAKLGFEDLSSALAGLTQLGKIVGDYEPATLPLSLSASPDRALQFLLRIAEVDSKLLAKVLESPDASRRLLAVVGFSDAVADNLLRRPELITGFFEPASIPESFVLNNKDRTQMRQHYRALLLEIIDWDLQQHYLKSYRPVAEALSDLACAALSSGLDISRDELLREGRITSEQAAEVKLAVIAMGKCGARELNYLSDVDVIYVSNSDGDSLATATKIAARLALVMDEAGVEPGLWQVDANLRPEGKDGALVRSVDSHVSYYQKWAHAWEFQALLKARFVAGDPAPGLEYEARVKALIWEKTNRAEIVESARNLRLRVLELIPQSERDREIKLGRGGLRDVEFTAQLLQMVHGIADVSLRVMNTLDALQALSKAGLLSRVDSESFSFHYIALRGVEHRVQLLKLRRTHLMPIDEGELRRIARSLDTAWGVEELAQHFRKTRAEVAQLHDTVFYRPLLAATASLSPGEVSLSTEEISSRLTALGFKDPSGAIGHIRALTTGISRRAVIQRTLLPVLIRYMAEGTGPDRALITFRRLSERLGDTHWFLKMLRDSSGAAERLMATLSLSAFACRLLEHIPESCAWFADKETLVPSSELEIAGEMQSLVERGNGEVAVEEALRQIRRREVLRTAVGSLLGLVDMTTAGESLAAITDCYVAAMLRHCQLRLESNIDICVVAMGRLGGKELGFGSDADVMLVYRGDLEGDQRTAEQLTGDLVDRLRDSVLNFELDLDLRPEGKNGPRIRSIEAYRGYYRRWAETWEFQALTRARPFTGSPELQAEFVELIDGYRFPQELTALQLTDIRRVKARVESERLPQGADAKRHLKLGRGSISDVEWLVQVFQLRFGRTNKQLQSTGTMTTLNELSRLGLVGKDEATLLENAWMLASRIRGGIVLGQDRSVDSLPVDRDQLETVARTLGYQPGSALELEESYLSTTRKARVVFERLF